jgi:hypothetical protein
MLDTMLEQSKQWVQWSGAPKKVGRSGEEAIEGRKPGAASRGGAGGASRVIKVIEKKNKRESESRRMMRWAKGVKNQEGVQDWGNLEWGSVYNKVDKKGVPQLQSMERKMGKDKPELTEGVGLWSFIDTVAIDLMMLSRAENT